MTIDALFLATLLTLLATNLMWAKAISDTRKTIKYLRENNSYWRRKVEDLEYVLYGPEDYPQ